MCHIGICVSPQTFDQAPESRCNPLMQFLYLLVVPYPFPPFLSACVGMLHWVYPSSPGLRTSISPICHEKITLYKRSIFGCGSHWTRCAFWDNPMGMRLPLSMRVPISFVLHLNSVPSGTVCLFPVLKGQDRSLPTQSQRPRIFFVKLLEVTQWR